jgi:GTP cyclohydrolase IA
MMSDLATERFDHWERRPGQDVLVVGRPSQLGSPFLNDASDEEAALELLQRTTGLDPESEHGQNTPTRFVKMLRELTSSPAFAFTTFESQVDEMVTIRDIPFVSLCAHHVVPFMGICHIAYIPAGRIAGLSKFARVVNMFARQLQVQEELTVDIADYLEEQLRPVGVAVVMKAEHLCMTIRGVQTPGTQTVTQVMRGAFADHDRTAKSEFMAMLTI